MQYLTSIQILNVRPIGSGSRVSVQCQFNCPRCGKQQREIFEVNRFETQALTKGHIDDYLCAPCDATRTDEILGC